MIQKTRGPIQYSVIFDLHIECCAPVQLNDEGSFMNLFSHFYFLDFDVLTLVPKFLCSPDDIIQIIS